MSNRDQNSICNKYAHNSVSQFQNSAFKIFDILARGQIVAQSISIVAKLRIPDNLRDGPKSVGEMAVSAKVNPDALYRMLRMLASVGIFREIVSSREEKKQNEYSKARRFQLTPTACLLCSQTENSVRDFALLSGLDSLNKATINLLHTIKTGKNSFKYANGLEMFDYFQRKKNRTDAEIFDNAMTSLNLSYKSSLVRLYDFSQFKTILDIGGGQGLFLSHILKENPNQHGILFDLPKVIQRAKENYWASNKKRIYGKSHHHSLNSRCKLIGGDFFKDIPYGADGYIIKNVLLNWDDESVTVLLRNCLRTMKRSSSTVHGRSNLKRPSPKLVIIETIMPEGNAPFLGKFTDILMLVLTRGGRLRTEIQLTELLKSCGFNILNVLRPPDKVSFLSVIEAVPRTRRS